MEGLVMTRRRIPDERHEVDCRIAESVENLGRAVVTFKGKVIGVVVPMNVYERIEELEDMIDGRIAEQRLAADRDTAIPFEEFVRELDLE